MTQTNMAVLEVACRNKIAPGWFQEMRRISGGDYWAPRVAENLGGFIIAEYQRLMRLRDRKKRWRDA